MKFNFRETITINDFKSNFSNDDKISNIKRIARNTFEYIINGEKRIRLCETDIIIFKNSHYILNNGGFDSRLTIDRINQNIPHSYIYVNKGIWYYRDIRFFNGIKIQNKTGKILNKSKAPKVKNNDKKRKKILKQIKTYTDKINKMKTLPDDSSGDCFYCQMDFLNNKDHLLSHLKERYVMKSLIFRALIEKGYRYPHLNYNMEKNEINERDLIIKAVKDYFKYNLLKG